MKHNLTLLSVLGLNFGFTFAQDVQMLTAVGFPACAVPCIQAGNKAANEKNGCGLMDGVCQCTTGYKTAQEAVTSCILSTKPCGDADMAKIGTAGAALCAGSKQSVPSNGTSAAKPSSAGTSASATGSAKPSTAITSASVSASASTSASAGGAKPAASATSSQNAARPERTFAAGAMGLVGAVAAFVL